VQIEQQVRPVRDEQAPRRDGDALGRERGQFLEQAGQVDDDAVADDAAGTGVQDAGGDEVQLVLGASVIVDGVARVGAALRGFLF
jgi:hypothetical protein